MLYIVATPIGNLSDITFRAVEILKNVDIILAEDTRQTKKLLSHYGITDKVVWSYHARSPQNSIDSIIEYLKKGSTMALVSDAGTPAISDPGVKLVSDVKKHGIAVSPLPGASAFISALSASGFPSHRFEFLGFLPHKKGRQTILKMIAEQTHTMIFYESTHRIEKCVDQMHEFFPEKKICIARELTKIYEEFLIGTPSEIQQIFKDFPEKKKGEFVVLVSE